MMLSSIGSSSSFICFPYDERGYKTNIYRCFPQDFNKYGENEENDNSSFTFSFFFLYINCSVIEYGKKKGVSPLGGISEACPLSAPPSDNFPYRSPLCPYFELGIFYFRSVKDGGDGVHHDSYKDFVKAHIDDIPISLSQVRYQYNKNVYEFDETLGNVLKWRESICYLGFGVENSNGVATFSFSKASKRGNDVYRWKVRKRFENLLSFCDEYDKLSFIEGDKKEGYFTHVFKVTLTVDRNKYSLDEFNSSGCSHELDKYIKRVRNKYGRDIKVSRTYEVHKDGYLHVNVIFYSPTRVFPVVYLSGHKKRDGKHGNGCWRLKEKNDLSSLWSVGFCDIRAISNVHDLLEYALKYQIKYFHRKKNRDMQNKTMSVLSLYNKRSYSIPSSFENGIYDLVSKLINRGNSPRLDTYKHNSLSCDSFCSDSPEIVDSDCKNESVECVNESKTEFLGIFHETELQYFEDSWYFCTEVCPVVEYDKLRYLDDINTVRLCKFDSGSRVGKDGIPFNPKDVIKERKRKILYHKCVDCFVTFNLEIDNKLVCPFCKSRRVHPVFK